MSFPEKMCQSPEGCRSAAASLSPSGSLASTNETPAEERGRELHRIVLSDDSNPYFIAEQFARRGGWLARALKGQLQTRGEEYMCIASYRTMIPTQTNNR